MSSTEFYKGNSKYMLLCVNNKYSIYMKKRNGTDKTFYHLVENKTDKSIKTSLELSKVREKGGF